MKIQDHIMMILFILIAVFFKKIFGEFSSLVGLVCGVFVWIKLTSK